jgi:hypothetical protein
MKRMMMVMALAGISVSGCCCCRGLWPQQAVVAPVAAPAPCPPAYDPCATPPVTYGAPAGTYAPVPGYTPPPQW